MSAASRRFNQVRVSERIRRDQLEQGIPEQERVLPVVEPELKLVHVGLQVLGRKLVVGPDDGPLEQRPGAILLVAYPPLVSVEKTLEVMRRWGKC